MSGRHIEFVNSGGTRNIKVHANKKLSVVYINSIIDNQSVKLELFNSYCDKYKFKIDHRYKVSFLRSVEYELANKTKEFA